MLFERRYRRRAIGHVYVCDGGGLGNLTLPERFTDRGPEPAARPLTPEVLAELLELVRVIGRSLTGGGAA